MQETITIKQIWAPPGRSYPKVITSTEELKFNLYEDQKELAEQLKIGHTVQLDWFDTTSKSGNPIKRIQNVFVDGKPVIPQQTLEPEAKREVTQETKESKPPVKSYRDEDRTDARTAIMSAVDLVVAGKIEVGQILGCAEVFKRYFQGEITVKDEVVFEAIIKKYFTGIQ